MEPRAVISVCRTLPTPDNRSAGQFVIRRLAGMAAHARVRAVQPVPYFPLAKPLPAWVASGARDEAGVPVQAVPMLYVPALLKSLDGRWLERSIVPALQSARAQRPGVVVDAHFGYPDGVGAVRAARRLGLPVFVTLRGLEVDRLQQPGTRRQLLHALAEADGCIAVSHSLKAAVVAAGVDPARVTVIHNAVDRSAFRPGDRLEARRRLGLDLEAPLVVSVGNLIALKRHTVLVEAVARLQASRPDLRLAILGGGDADAGYRRALDQLVGRLGLGDRVRIVGRVPPAAVADWLRAANLFALATSREGCCNAVLEALACGIPIVTTPVGDNAHFVQDGDNGYLVAVDDVDAMAAAIAAALARTWNSDAVAGSLGVGDWDAVGRQVLDYFDARLAA